MTDFEKNLIALIRTAIGDSVSEEVCFDDYSVVYDFASKQQIIGMVFYGIKKMNIVLEESLMRRFWQSTVFLLQHSEKQLFEAARVLAEFRKHNIYAVPLKGLVLKKIYPTSDMRQMGDIDIYIDKKRYKDIELLMTRMGYVSKNETEYEFVWSKNDVVVELHSYLFDPKSEDAEEYTNACAEDLYIKRAAEMSCENMYIYLFLHFVKHYKKRGAGIRFIIDLYIYKKKFGDMDMEYVIHKLKELDLYDFYRNIETVIEVWFCGRMSDEKVDFITKKLFEGTVYGEDKNGYVANYNSEKNSKKFPRLRIMGRMIFPNFKTMKSKYKILEKCPVLFPAVVVYHWFFVLFCRRKSISNQMEILRCMTDENAEKMFDDLKYVGL